MPPLNTNFTKKIVFLTTLLFGVVILYPYLFFQDMFAQGDHGRDLYAFWMTSHGATPYRDYLWVYGPLMPYYYALFFKIFGEAISSILLGETLIKLFCGIVVFFIMAEISTLLWVFITTLFYWTFFPYFFYTYCHTGGIFFILLLMLCLVKYIYNKKEAYIYIGLIPIILLCFVKINFGVCALFTLLTCLFFLNKYHSYPLKNPKVFYITSCVTLPLFVFLIYFFFVNGLPDYVIKQCFPYTKTGSQSYINPFEIIPYLWISFKFFSPAFSRYLLLFLFLIINALIFVLTWKKYKKSFSHPLKITLLCQAFFFMTFLHEFYFSGVHYRLYWAIPFLIIAFFTMVYGLSQLLPKYYKWVSFLLIAFVILHKINTETIYMKHYSNPKYYFSHPRAGVLLGNDPEWFDTVRKTISFLEENLNEEELFLALPYEPLYYYLLERKSPTYQIAYFDYMKIPPAQDRQTVMDIESKNIQWVIFSNRIISSEPFMGTFGKTNSRLLADYLNKDFDMVQQWGYWDRPPVWNTYYGIRILKRKTE